MAGAIIENMSTKKLVIVGVILMLFQAFAFMVGGLIGKFLAFIEPFFNFLCVATLRQTLALCGRGLVEIRLFLGDEGKV